MIYNFSNRLSCICIMETIFNHRIEFVCCWGVRKHPMQAVLESLQ